MIGRRPSHILKERTAAERTPIDVSEIRVFARCRNERLRLEAFLRHYRGLGATRFFIVDNDSTDGTTEFLARQPDVSLFRTAARYADAAMGMDWVNALLAEFGTGYWCVTVDVDELLLFPGHDRTSLKSLTAFLDDNGFDAYACMMLDLYPPGPISECGYREGDNPLSLAPFFDPGPYERIEVDLCPGLLIRGGARERIFYPEFRSRGLFARLYDAALYEVVFHVPVVKDVPSIKALARPTPPCLTKVPLVRWDDKTRYVQSTHWISSKSVSRDTGVLLHFKFLQDFHARAVHEAERGQHWNNASEYRRYAAFLNANPDATFMYDGSTRLEGTAQLVRLGLISETREWTEYLSRDRHDVGKSPIGQ